MKKFPKVEQAFAGTTDASSTSLTKTPVLHHGGPLVISDKLVLVVLGLIQISDMAKRLVSLSEMNFAMAVYLLFIDLMFT